MNVLQKIKKIDWAIVLILLIFMGISTLLIHSAGYNDSKLANHYIRNAVFYALGFVVLFGTALVNYRILLKFAPVFYVASVISLVAVRYFGVVRGGARGWFEIPGIGLDLQPAELMKLFLILMLAYFLARKQGEPLQFTTGVVPAGLIAFIPFALVMLQPDLGNAIIYFVIIIAMLWIANVKYLHVLIGLALAAGLMIGAVTVIDQYHDEIEQFLEEKDAGHWMDRIDAYLYPENATSDQTYQINNSKQAIGSGGLFGEGYLQGTSVHNNYIPITYSDSIFVVLAEEFGFLGSSIVLLLFFLLIYRLIIVSLISVEPGGAYIITGIVAMFVFQIFQNIGMFLQILPLTGITLPFISYGGSSLIINMMSIGLALSIRIHANQPLDEDELS